MSIGSDPLLRVNFRAKSRCKESARNRELTDANHCNLVLIIHKGDEHLSKRSAIYCNENVFSFLKVYRA